MGHRLLGSGTCSVAQRHCHDSNPGARLQSLQSLPCVQLADSVALPCGVCSGDARDGSALPSLLVCEACIFEPRSWSPTCETSKLKAQLVSHSHALWQLQERGHKAIVASDR